MTPPTDEAPDFDRTALEGLEEAKRLHAEGHFDIGTDEAQAGEPRRLDAFELAQNVEREMVRAAPPKIEGGSEARRQWLADVLAVQMAFHESGAGIEFTRAFDDNPFSESAPPVAPLGETDR